MLFFISWYRVCRKRLKQSTRVSHFFLLNIYWKMPLMANAFYELFIHRPSKGFIQLCITVCAFIYLKIAIHWFCSASCFMNLFGQPLSLNTCALFWILPEILFCVNRQTIKPSISRLRFCVPICCINHFG